MERIEKKKCVSWVR